MNNKRWDYLIIGAGIIGLTLARELKERFPSSTILLLEKESFIGKHASGRNSGVLHTGIYYPAETLKAKFCKQGADLLFAYAQEHRIPVRKDGKIIVATSEAEFQRLDLLLSNAKANQISAVKILESEIREIEPLASCEYGGIYCKDTAVIDSQQVLEALRHELKANKIDIIFNQKIMSIDDAKQTVQTTGTVYHYGLLINAAGSHADKVAKLVHVGPEYVLMPFKGAYYKLNSKIGSNLRMSIYPVPNPDLPFLGVHLTRDINDDVYIGPTIIPVFGRENYGGIKGVTLREALGVSTKLCKLYTRDTQNFRNLTKKAISHSRKSGVIHSVRGLMNQLEPSWVEKSSKIGIRPQLLNTKDMRLEMDFLIKKGRRSVHVLNSISPAFTSSFAVAKHIINEISR